MATDTILILYRSAKTLDGTYEGSPADAIDALLALSDGGPFAGQTWKLNPATAFFAGLDAALAPEISL